MRCFRSYATFGTFFYTKMYNQNNVPAQKMLLESLIYDYFSGLNQILRRLFKKYYTPITIEKWQGSRTICCWPVLAKLRQKGPKIVMKFLKIGQNDQNHHNLILRNW